MQDSPEYLKRKARFREMLTIYGRNPVLEALQQPQVQPVKLHLSRRNRPAEVLDQIRHLASDRGAEIIEQDPAVLARISRNAKQDQGVALDARLPSLQTLKGFLADTGKRSFLIALDGVTNPQNLGMIVRSVAASPCDGLLLCDDSCTAISPLVIKASAGSLFKAPIVREEKLQTALGRLGEAGFTISTLEPGAKQNLLERVATPMREVLVLGSETRGVCPATKTAANAAYHLPMAREVESLNVAVTAALVAFLSRPGS